MGPQDRAFRLQELRASSAEANTIHILNSWFTLDIEQAFSGEEKQWLEKSTKTVMKDSGPRNKYFSVGCFSLHFFPPSYNSHTHTQEGKLLSNSWSCSPVASPAPRRMVLINVY